ncbi:hypothetical protein [Streptomyces sp. A012304]|uniref:hypothetical protein n=1 Tax=Streptomyces sp. A012304 TaxID=375446 RepID=UPI002231BD71|nr:hypothetical protein [Streptomyces sp. A012304]
MGSSKFGVGVHATGGEGNPGVFASSEEGPTADGQEFVGVGVFGTVEGGDGVQGSSRDGNGVRGWSTNGVGVSAGSDAGVSVFADTGELALDLIGDLTGSGIGIAAVGQIGLLAAGADKAARFEGDVEVTGSINKSACEFRIDHPLDPANRVLAHCSVESSERKNMYDGTVTLDAHGEATVTLPDWFTALNGRLCYQLTPLDGPAPRLHVVRHEEEAGFDIRGGLPRAAVCWQVTGVRQDPWALAHPLHTEEDKP